ncbi:hypothetical protein M0812_03748 [Anaeramoeba flamelloides]|uniref:Uncharacterized protein n=1 Tax=Anaeramoeba flamelloides TaxID=1746091 RepID=A0AAV8ACK1_9EUKA|nr:hypothetical protein M0812_03748 [Anaeramoeba flamelloides]
MFQQLPITGIQLLSLELDSPSTIQRKRIFEDIITKRMSKQSSSCQKIQEEEPFLTNQTHFKKKKRQNTPNASSQFELPLSVSNSENIPETYYFLKKMILGQTYDRNYQSFRPLTNKNNNIPPQSKSNLKNQNKRQSKRLDTIVNKITQNKEQNLKKTSSPINSITLKMKQRSESSQKKSLLFYKFKLSFLVDKIKKSTNY